MFRGGVETSEGRVDGFAAVSRSELILDVVGDGAVTPRTSLRI